MSISIDSVMLQADRFFGKGKSAATTDFLSHGNTALAIPSLDSRAQEAWGIYAADPVEGITIDCSRDVDEDGASLADDVRVINRSVVDDLLAADGELMMQLIQKLRENPQEALYWLTSQHEVQAYELIVHACRDKQFPA